MLKAILFTHDDLDGAGCRIVFDLWYDSLKYLKGLDYDVLNCSNGNIDEVAYNTIVESLASEKISAKTNIYFADISPNRETLLKIINEFPFLANSIIIYDHHRSNFFAEHIIENAHIVPENELGIMQSGTSLLYQHFCELLSIGELALKSGKKIDEMDHFYPSERRQRIFEKNDWLAYIVDLIRSYDTYEWKQTNNIAAKKLFQLFILLEMDLFCDNYEKSTLKSHDTSEPDYYLECSNDVKFIINRKIEKEKNIISQLVPEDMYKFDVKGKKCLLIFPIIGANISEIGNSFLANHPEYDIIFQVSFYNDSQTIEMRSVKDDFNIGTEIAAPIGGGGHPKAAGCRIKESVVDLLISNIIDFLNERL
jgi:oligoribonuclease NrnB/cAMP/cGMP phosphodiesterase (DHH superfamily)